MMLKMLSGEATYGFSLLKKRNMESRERNKSSMERSRTRAARQ